MVVVVIQNDLIGSHGMSLVIREFDWFQITVFYPGAPLLAVTLRSAVWLVCV